MGASNQAIRRCQTKRGVRILQHGTVLSEVLRKPGPTHSVVDVMAAAIQILSPGPKVAMLGFSGGGLLGPLRAMNGRHEVEAIDIDDHGFKTFESLCRPWAGPVRFGLAEAGQWLWQTKARFDAIVVDLSISQKGEVHIPDMVWRELPQLIPNRLRRQGVALFNLLRPTRGSWKEGLAILARPFSRSWVVELKEFENRLFLAGPSEGHPRSLSLSLSKVLETIGSDQAHQIAVRRFR